MMEERLTMDDGTVTPAAAGVEPAAQPPGEPVNATSSFSDLFPVPSRPTLEAPVLLAIDTCTQRSSVALRDAFTLRAECSWESDRHHTAAVSIQIRRLMQSCSITPEQIGAVAVAIGPGSFTGVRCGLAIAKGMAVARNIPLIGVSAFEVIVSAQPKHHMPVFALVEAGRGRSAVCRYEWHGDTLHAVPPWTIQRWQEFANTIDTPAWVCGDLSPALAALLEMRATLAPASYNLRRAGFLAELGYARWQNAETDDPLSLMPIYPPES
jgi:tRNA threonylcarbamoyladenosine biosynthesis protein TsaB